MFLRTALVGVVGLMALVSFVAPVSAQEWGKVGFISSTLGNTLNRVCVGAPSTLRPGDLGCSSNAPYVSPTSGYVGIGTTGPSYPLDVSGILNLGGPGNPTLRLNHVYHYIERSGTANNYFASGHHLMNGASGVIARFNVPDLTSNFNGGITVGSGYYALTPPAHGAIIQGNVGIATSAPQATLQVSGSFVVSTSAQVTTPSLYVGVDGNVVIGGTNAGGPVNYAPLTIDTKGVVNKPAIYIANAGAGYTGIHIGQFELGSRQSSGYNDIRNTNSGIHFRTHGNAYNPGSSFLFTHSPGPTSATLVTLRSAAETHLQRNLLAFENPSSQVITAFDGSGSLVIGGTTPTTPLEVFGTISATALYVTASTGVVSATTMHGHYASFTTLYAGALTGDGSGLTGITADATDRITSGTTQLLVVSNTGYISLTQAGSNTGWFSPYTGLVTLGVSSTGGISGTSGYFTGNVGVGTSGPTTELEVIGKISATNLNVSQIVTASFYEGDGSRLTGISANQIGGLLGDRIVSGTTKITAYEDTSLTFTTAGSQRMVLDERGYLGVGTSAPSLKLEVSSGHIGIDNNYYLQGYVTGQGYRQLIGRDASQNTVIGHPGTSVIADTLLYAGTSSKNIRFFANGSTESVRIAHSGNVGIGTTSATATLQVSGSFIVSTSAQTTTPSLYVGTNGFVGVGTSAPAGNLNIVRQDSNYYYPSILINHTGTTSGGAPGLFIKQSSATNGIASALVTRGASSGRAVTAYGTSDVALSTATPQWLVGIGAYTGGATYNFGILEAMGGTGIEGSGNGITYAADRFVIETGGNVGISTTNPNATLDVNGTISATALYVTASTGVVSATTMHGHYASFTTLYAGALTGDGSGLTGIGSGDAIISGTTNITAYEDTSLTFTTAGSQRMVIDERGYLGIGTANPTMSLQVTAATAGLVDIAKIGSVNNNRYIKMLSLIGTDANTRMAIQSYHTDSDSNYWDLLLNPLGGNVGIGMTSPQATLQVSGSFVVSTSAQVTTPSLYVGTNGKVGVGTSAPSAQVEIKSRTGQTFPLAINIDGTTSGGKMGLLISQTANSGGAVGAFISRGRIDGTAITAYGTSAAGVSGTSPSYSEWATGIIGNNSNYQIDEVNGSIFDTWNSYAKSGNNLYHYNRLTIQKGGNVGIGTTAPTKTLEVSGTARITSDTVVSGTVTLSGMGDEVCSAAALGKLRFDPTTGSLDICR